MKQGKTYGNFCTPHRGIPVYSRFFSLFSQKKHIGESPKTPMFSTCSAGFTTFTFTGKEKDSETGYYAFGARYYDCDLSGLFLSVDPMSDKYPNLSPYAYCAWNPVKLVDPGGDSCVFMDEAAKNAFDKAYSNIINELNSMEKKGKTGGVNYQKIKSMKDCFDGVMGSNTIFYYSSKSNKDNDGSTILNGGSTYGKVGVTGICVDVILGSESSIVHETRHAYGYHLGEWEIDFNSIIDGKYSLINYDYKDEYEAYKMQYDYSNWFLGDNNTYDDWKIESLIRDTYGPCSKETGIITEFTQYTKNNPYKKKQINSISIG